MIWPDPTHQPTQPPTKPHTHSWVGNSSQISNLQTELKYLYKLKCYRILSDSGGPPPGGWRTGELGWGWVWVCGGVFHAYTHAHAWTHMHARMHMHVKHVVNMINMDASMSAAICNFYTCINVHVCMCMHARACACVWGHLPMPPDAPPPTCPLPRTAGSPKQQNSISPELIEIIRFCLKILYLWTFLNSYRL